MLDAATLLELGGGSGDYDTETVLFTFSTGPVEQDLALTRDGFVFGWQSSATNFGISINTALPSSVPSATQITFGLVYCTNGTNATLPFFGFRHPFKKNDTLRVKNYSASGYVIHVMLGYRR